MFDRDAYLADVASAVKLAKARKLELYGMVRTRTGRFEGMMRKPEKATPTLPEPEPLTSTRGAMQGSLL